ncbi:MAG TPA: efflux RND transporter periplasmic adaptor subunit [Puia sp.]|nr:efflux RND transporter periplasmic adaptor subunit [Puia sp.]
MNKILTVVVIGSYFLVTSCGSGAAQNDGSLEGKKAQLTALKDQQDKLEKQIGSLEKEIDKADPAAAVKEKAKLVTLTALTPTSFTHFIDLQGNVEAENTSYISPRGAGGVTRSVLVKKGEQVKKGQLLLKLDDAIQGQQLANAKTQLAYAKDLYQRRKNLWDQKIGTEVDFINAKNQVDQMESQVKIAQEQLDFTNVYADMNGVVDDITVKVGESFGPGSQQLRLVNTDNLKVVVQIPEVYQERVRVGTPVKITFPGLNNKTITGTVRVAGKEINTGSRSFTVEIRIPNDREIRANQVAVVKLQDYAATNALTIPVNTLQTDEKGKYVMVGVTQNGKTLAHKVNVTIGQLYEDKIEIKSGLQPGDHLVTDGFQGLYEGQLLTTQ